MTAHADRERDLAFMGWVKTQRCMLAREPFAGECSGGGWSWSEADHAGERAGWRRADDATCIPLCHRHHRDRTERRDWFAGRPWPWMRAWCDAAIATTRERWAAWQVAPF